MCEASVKDSTLTAADQQNEDTLESLCVCLLKCCDTAYIPAVTVRHACMHTHSQKPVFFLLFF